MEDGVLWVANREAFVALAKGLGVRDDWHEPDEEDVSAEVTGYRFDNAGTAGEIIVHLLVDGDEVAQANLASLCAWASDPRGVES